MLRLLADHNFEQQILDGLRNRIPIDLVTAREIGFASVEDPDLLAWAAREGRVLLTHDRQTMPGVVVVQDRAAVGRAVDDLHILVACASTDDCQGQVQYLPWPD